MSSLTRQVPRLMKRRSLDDENGENDGDGEKDDVVLGLPDDRATRPRLHHLSPDPIHRPESVHCQAGGEEDEDENGGDDDGGRRQEEDGDGREARTVFRYQFATVTVARGFHRMPWGVARAGVYRHWLHLWGTYGASSDAVDEIYQGTFHTRTVFHLYVSTCEP